MPPVKQAALRAMKPQAHSREWTWNQFIHSLKISLLAHFFTLFNLIGDSITRQRGAVNPFSRGMEKFPRQNAGQAKLHLDEFWRMCHNNSTGIPNGFAAWAAGLPYNLIFT
jgi:hypothetical protein